MPLLHLFGVEVWFHLPANDTVQLALSPWHCLESSEKGVSNEGLSSLGWPLGMSVVNYFDFFNDAREDGLLWAGPWSGIRELGELQPMNE